MIHLSIEHDRYRFSAEWHDGDFELLLPEGLFIKMLVATGIVAEKAITAAVEKLMSASDGGWAPKRATGGRMLTHDEAVSVLIALGNVKAVGLLHELREAFHEAKAEVDEWVNTLRDGANVGHSSPNLPRSRAEFESAQKQEILAALVKHNWNKVRAANELGIPRRTFYRKLSEFGVESPSAPAPAAVVAAPAPKPASAKASKRAPAERAGRKKKSA